MKLKEIKMINQLHSDVQKLETELVSADKKGYN